MEPLAFAADRCRAQPERCCRAGLALLAFKLSKVGSTSEYTYGYKRSTIIVSFFNALVLFVAVGFIGYEAVMRFIHPRTVEGGTMAWVAFAGIGINAVTA